jgi:hypothetical protein
VHRACNHRARLLIGVLAVGAAVGAALPGGAAGAQQDGQGAAGVELEASAGFAGRYLVGRRLPITVDITADRLVRGSVVVQVDGLQGTWSVPVEVPGGSSKEVVLVVPTPAGFAVREVDVTLRDGGDEVASAQPEVEGLAEDELVGLLPGALPADLPEPVTLPGEVGTARFVRVELEQLAIPGLLDPIGTVVAGADEVGRLDAAGRAELLSWTDRGGRLVVDSAPSATVAGLPDDWQPDGEVRRVAGLGEVRASSGRAAAGDWDAVVEATPTVSSQELAAFGWWGSGESLSDSLARDAGLDALDLPWLAGFVIAYIALCGPVAYFALRGRRNLGWVVVPGLAVVFTAAAFVVGDDLRAGTTTSHGTVLEVSSAGSRATTIVGAVSRSGADGEATFPAGWTVAPLDSTALGIDAGGPIAVTTTPDGAQAAIPLAAGDFGVARGTGPVAAAGDDGALVTVEATSEDGTVTGTVTNNSDLHLERVGVFVGRAGAHIDAIAPGDSATFSIEGGEFTRGDPYAPAEAQVWPAESGYGIEFNPARSAESIVNLALLQDHLAPLGPNARPRGVATVIGWTRDLDSPAHINGPDSPEGRSIVIARGAVASGDGTVAQGSARREILRGPNGVELPDDEEIGGGMEGYVWRFTLPEGAEVDDPAAMSVSIPGYIARIDAWDGERWVTVDRRSGQFLGDLAAQRIVDLPPGVVIDGRVLVRGFGVSDFGPTMAEGIDVFEAAS